MPRPVRLLHLSDLHFAPTAFAFTDKERQPDPNQLISMLRRDPELETPPEAIVISGDVSSRGDPTAYEYALRFIQALQAQWPAAKLLVVPGNHDVLLDEPADPHHAFVAMLKQVYGDEFSTLYPFALPDGRFARRQCLVAIHRVPGRLLIVAANSAANIKAATTTTPDGERVIDDRAHLDDEVLELIAEKLKGLGDGRELRVFVMHHHLLPFIPDWEQTIQRSSAPGALDASMVGNSAELQGWLGSHGFHMLLHGHKHKSHGRLDTLWRPDADEGASVLIVGGGSSGVVHAQRAPQPLSYNILTAERGVGSWTVQVSVRKIPDSKEPGRNPSEYHSYSTVVGPPPASAPLIFHAESTEDCHRAIAQRTTGKRLLPNFISIVETSEYSHPPTVMLGSRGAGLEDVERAFIALHPEWKPTEQEPNLEWRPLLEAHTHGYRFRHGPLMFNLPRPKDASSPIEHALDSLGGEHRSRAYVPIAHVDVGNPKARELLTGLTGLQFIEDENAESLDLVATFRKLELSFWWAVNMYECSKLLRWAASGLQNRKPRRITFFAALAEWKPSPEIPSIAELDTLGLRGLARIASAVSSGDVQAKDELTRLLHEKAKYTNDTNIDASGLHLLVQIARGIRDGMDGEPPEAFSLAFLAKAEEAEYILTEALEKPDSKGITTKLNGARKALTEAAELLDGKAQAP